MNSQQKRRERKLKRRDKIRQEHLQKDRRDVDGEALARFFRDREVLRPGTPERNDREGWARFNALDLKCVVKAAIQMYGKDSTLWRFIRDPHSATKHDIGTLEAMFTKAAQKICCSPPYFIPMFVLQKSPTGMRMHQPKFIMDKASTPFGLAWYNDNFEGAFNLVFINKKPKLFSFSTHAIERLIERMFKPMCLSATRIAFVMNTMQPEKVTHCSEGTVIPLSISNGDERYLIGYCPFDEHNHMAIARTFLLPTMKGTPERDKLVELGLESFSIDTMTQLMDRRAFLESKGVKLEYTETVTQ